MLPFLAAFSLCSTLLWSRPLRKKPIHCLSLDKLNTKIPTEGIFRIIQSISSPKAEPFKRWLAKVGYERIQEKEDKLRVTFEFWNEIDQ